MFINKIFATDQKLLLGGGSMFINKIFATDEKLLFGRGEGVSIGCS